MLAEIQEQPEALRRTLRDQWPQAEALRKLLEAKRPRLIVLAARGTSDNAAQFGRYLLEISTCIPVSLAAPSIYSLYGSTVDFRDALVVAISQSGESTDTNLVLERAKASGAFTVGITNEEGSSLTRIADHVLLVRAGKEKSVAATKTYTGQMMALYLIAYALGAPIEFDQLSRIPDYVDVALRLEEQVAAHSERFTFMGRAVSVARGLNYSNAFEFALKLMETCYVVAERFSAADLLHGPIAMVEHAFPTFLFAPSGPTWQPMCEMIAKVRSLQADCTVITDLGNGPAVETRSKSLVIQQNLSFSGPLPADVFTPIPYIVPAQLFAAHLAVHKGLNPDAPRTLSKVTLTL